MPKASFVIATRDNQDTISEAIESCLKQTVNDIEVVVVNDSSTDDTQRFIDYWKEKDKRVVAVKAMAHLGRSEARNVGIERASGPIIMILDGDDLSLAIRAERTIKYFKKRKEIGLVYGGFYLIDELNNVLGREDAKAADEAKVRETLLFGIGHSTMAFRREVFDKVRYTDGPYSENAIDDWKFQADCRKAGVLFGHIDEPISQYRVRPKPRDEEKIKELKLACLA